MALQAKVSSSQCDCASMPYILDLHIHTARYSTCAQTLDPTEVATALARRGLDGGVLTEHDQLWNQAALQELRQAAPQGIHLYGGVEISTAVGHIVAINLVELADIPVGVSLERLVAVAREQEAALIWAHPFLGYRGLQIPTAGTALGEGIHAMEVASSVTRGESCDRAVALAEQKGWFQVAGSDAHALPNIGVAATCFARLPEDERMLARAIMAGQCSPAWDLIRAIP